MVPEAISLQCMSRFGNRPCRTTEDVNVYRMTRQEGTLSGKADPDRIRLPMHPGRILLLETVLLIMAITNTTPTDKQESSSWHRSG